MRDQVAGSNRPEPNAGVFARVSAQYVDARPQYPPAIFDWLQEQVPARRLAWDIGCGSGQATVALAPCFARVIANDLSAEQLAYAPPLANVEWRAQPAEEVEVEPGSVDLAVAASSVHWLPLDRFYPRVQRALARGGLLAVFTYTTTVVPPAVKAVITQEFAALKAYWSAGNRVASGGYRELPFPFDEIAAPSFAIELDWTVEQYLAFAGTWSSTLRHDEVTGTRLVDLARPRVAAAWGVGTQPVTLPLALRVGRVPTL
jgi:SAM-dependent methyltransferase